VKTIWKHTLKMVDGPQELVCPVGSKPLSCEQQDGEIRVWMLVNSSNRDTESWTFWIAGTGHPLPIPEKTPFAFLNSLVMGPFVWHVFYKSKTWEVGKVV
jgi:hypothetical protein